MRKTVVINVVGLTRALIGEHTPNLRGLMDRGKLAYVTPPLPAVTTTVQSTYLTGRMPAEHGIVGNGWYFHEECEIKFWRQSNRLVQGEKIWERAKREDPPFTCANLCWWYAMYSAADYTVTPRPMYPADGRKIPDCWTHPGDLRHWLQRELGTFPLFEFWGPRTTILSSKWIADAARLVDERHNPTLSLVYLPHLDYVLQRHGPAMSDPLRKDLAEIDQVCGELIRHFESRGARVMVVSEYGMAAVTRPVHLNRVFREKGWIVVREEMGREILDAGESVAFAVADHQVAHVYVNDPSKLNEVRAAVEATAGVAEVLNADGKKRAGVDHPRAGDLVVLADTDAWFTYYYWLDDRRAPDFARTVDIHRKPGYDPAELFIDPKIALPGVKVAWTLLKRKLGMRSLLEVVGLDAGLVKGSHGLVGNVPAEGPVVIADASLIQQDQYVGADVYSLIWASLQSQ